MNLPPLPFNPNTSYDCPTCGGESRRLETDCPTCGGTGWRPPTSSDPVASCDDCGRPLWTGRRGPQWFENSVTERVACRFCITRGKKNRRCALVISRATTYIHNPMLTGDD